MFDGLRNDASKDSGFDEGKIEFFPDDKPVRSSARSTGKFLGMTSQQRFILAVMLMIAVCALGGMFLLLTGKFVF